MCGRFYVPESDEIRFLTAIIRSLESRNVRVKTGEVCPGNLAAVVARSWDQSVQCFGMHWGYHLSGGKLVFNTRWETAAQKPMFADGIRQRRCLIPAGAYFEWERRDAGKQKYAILPEGGAGFFLGGIYRLEGSTPVFSVLTQNPAPEIAFIHDRMPVMIPEARAGEWLNPENDGMEIIRSIHLPMQYRSA